MLSNGVLATLASLLPLLKAAAVPLDLAHRQGSCPTQKIEADWAFETKTLTTVTETRPTSVPRGEVSSTTTVTRTQFISTHVFSYYPSYYTRTITPVAATTTLDAYPGMTLTQTHFINEHSPEPCRVKTFYEQETSTETFTETTGTEIVYSTILYDVKTETKYERVTTSLSTNPVWTFEANATVTAPRSTTATEYRPPVSPTVTRTVYQKGCGSYVCDA